MSSVEVRRLNIISAEYAAQLIQSAYQQVGVSLIKLPGYKNPVGRHFRLVNQDAGTVHHVKFAREFFHSLGKFFPEYEGAEAETINAEVVEQLKDDDSIYFANNEKIFTISVKDFKEKSVSRVNNAGTKVCHIPISELEEFL